MITGLFDSTPRFQPREFRDAEQAVARIREIYETNTAFLRNRFQAYVKGEQIRGRVRVCYPSVRINTAALSRTDTRISYGFLASTGLHATTLTRPDIFERYLVEQFTQLLRNHDEPLEVGVSDTPIAVHFAWPGMMHLEGTLGPEQIADIRSHFDLPDLDLMDDSIVNGTFHYGRGAVRPLAHFTAPRIDLSLQRLRHYTGTSPEHFQNFILFTNYPFYIDEFIARGQRLMQRTDEPCRREESERYTAFVSPHDHILHNQNLDTSCPAQEGIVLPDAKMPQMPAYHLKRPNNMGITMINIGVGPSNAKTITDHLAVLRPHAWLMLGHCAGLRNTQRLGDYVLAHGYVREDHVLDQDLPLSVPIPALSEIQLALEKAVTKITGISGYALKSIMRTGTVATIDDRNWELRDHVKMLEIFSQSRAIALDMESATIAANGLRLRVPYGTLLCVSDKPLHGEPKLPGMAQNFYRQQVEQHVRIGIHALEILAEDSTDRLHSRKLRSLKEPPFR